MTKTWQEGDPIQREDNVPLLVRNPLMEVNKNLSHREKNIFFTKLIQVIENKKLDTNFDAGVRFLKERYYDHPMYNQMASYYLNANLNLFGSMSLVKDTKGTSIQNDQETNVPFFLICLVKKDSINSFWNSIKRMLTTDFGKDGFKFKLRPSLYTPRDLERLKCDNLFAMRKAIIDAKIKSTDVFISDPLVSYPASDSDFVNAIVFGTIAVSQEYMIRYQGNQEKWMPPIANFYSDRAEAFEDDNFEIAPVSDYPTALNNLFMFECRRGIAELVDKIKVIKFKSVMPSFEDNYCSFHFETQQNKKFHFGFCWPALFEAVIYQNVDEFLDEATHLDRIGQEMREITAMKEALNRKVIFADNEDFMDVEVDKKVVNEELSRLFKKSM